MPSRNYQRRILLLDDSPRQRDKILQQLVSRGFQVEVAESVNAAERVWQPWRYELVLVRVRKELEDAADFCDEIRTTHPEQAIGLLVSTKRRIPPTRHCGILWPEEDLPHLIARIEALAALTAAA